MCPHCSHLECGCLQPVQPPHSRQLPHGESWRLEPCLTALSPTTTATVVMLDATTATSSLLLLLLALMLLLLLVLLLIQALLLPLAAAAVVRSSSTAVRRLLPVHMAARVACGCAVPRCMTGGCAAIAAGVIEGTVGQTAPG